MGLSIHYSGMIKNNALIPQLVEEVQDVCDVLGWPWHLNNETVVGISFTPPECETVGLNFLSNGEIVSKVMLLYNIHPATTVSVKTQFAGMEVHMAVIKLLKHLAKQYFSRFELTDEGQYWETGDEELLRKYFRAYNGLMNAVQTTMMDFKAVPGETRRGFVQRLEAFLQERLNKGWADQP